MPTSPRLSLSTIVAHTVQVPNMRTQNIDIEIGQMNDVMPMLQKIKLRLPQSISSLCNFVSMADRSRVLPILARMDVRL